jgi:hypothetical protein
MPSQVAARVEGRRAMHADVRVLSRMCVHVRLQVVAGIAGVATLITGVGFFSSVCSDMLLQVAA